MTKKRQFRKVALLASLSAGGMTFQAHAFDFDTGNPDLSVSMINTLRYNYARRMQDIDPHVAFAGPAPAYAYAAGDYLFEKGDTISNRIDVLSELNISYLGQYGLRVTGAGWYDQAYRNKRPVQVNGVSPAGTPYANFEYTDVVKRYYAGPSGEFLDAFVFGNFSVAGVENNVRLGRHASVWGEGLFGSTHSLAYSQAPSDGRKQVSSPGASAKETALPIGQLSVTSLLTPTLTALAYYQYEWRATRVPEGGTYFAPGDAVLEGPNQQRAPTLKGEGGAFGAGLKWLVEPLDSTFGFYYRRFDDMSPGWATQLVSAPATTRTVYARGVDLYGVSFAKNIFGASVASELSYRRNGALTSSAAVNAGSAGGYEGARGNTWHAVLNATKTFGGTLFFSNASLAAELAWSRLDKLTRNQQLYRAEGHDPSGVCNAAAAAGNPQNIRGCIDGSFYSAGVQFTPVWQQALPGMDLSMPLFFSRNYGNAASAGGGSDGFATYKVGLSASVYQQHQIDLAYTWWHQKVDRSTPLTTNALAPTGVYGRLQGAPYSDKGNLSITYQYSF